MAKTTFGSEPKNQDVNSLTAEVHNLVGVKFPISLVFEGGKLVGGSYETSWKTGAIVTSEGTDDHGNVTYKNDANYSAQKLTKEQIKKIDGWIEQKLAEQ